MKEQTRPSQQQAGLPRDLTIVGLQSLYDQKYLTTSRQNEKPDAGLIAKMSAWLLTIYDIGVSWIGGYVLSASLLSWVPALLHPVFLIACIITGLFQAALSLGSNIGDAQSSLGVWLFPEDKEVQDFKKRLEITKAAYEDLTDQIKRKKFSQAQLHALLKLVQKNNEEIKVLYNKIQGRQKVTVKYKIAKYVVLGLSSALHFGGGFMLGKGVLGLIGLAFVPTPVTIAIGVVAGVLALTSFLVLKRHIIVGNLNRLLRKSMPLSDNMKKFIFSRFGINQFEHFLYNKVKNHAKTTYNRGFLSLNKQWLVVNRMHLHKNKLKLGFFKTKSRKVFYKLATNDSYFFSKAKNCSKQKINLYTQCIYRKRY